MPNGKTHAAATVVASGAIGPIAFYCGICSIAQAVALSIGTMTGLLLTPDLDVRIGSRSFWLVRQSFGSFIGFAWQWFWQPYARLIPRHRHPLSHLPILGTFLRLVYLFLVLGAAYWAARTLLIFAFGSLAGTGIPWVDQLNSVLPDSPGLKEMLAWPYFWWGAAGLMISDTLHTLMDYTWPWQ